MSGAGIKYIFFYTASITEQYGISIADSMNYFRIVLRNIIKQHYFFCNHGVSAGLTELDLPVLWQLIF
jgi:hypothetical protein